MAETLDPTDLYAAGKAIKGMTDQEAFDALVSLKHAWIRAAGRDTVQSVQKTVDEIIHRIRVVHVMGS